MNAFGPGVLIMLGLALTACGSAGTHTQEPDNSYVMVSGAPERGDWVLVQHGTFNGRHQHRRFTLRCTRSFDETTGETFDGPGVCRLPVGEYMPETLVAKLTAVRDPNRWWNSPNRRPLFVQDMSNSGLLSVQEESAQLGGRILIRQSFNVVKIEAEDVAH